MNESKPKWLICVDTGGTFTDCLALSPSGEWKRAKILSSSALRGMANGVVGSDQMTIAENWDAPIPFVTGFTFRALDGSGFVSRVMRHETKTLFLETPAPHGMDSIPFEVVASFDAPILAARLATGTSIDKPLPPHDLRLATTRGTNALLTRLGEPPAFFVTAGHGDLIAIGTQQRPDLFALDIQKPEPLYRTVIEVPERLNGDGSVLRPMDEDFIRDTAKRLVAEGVRDAAICLLHSYRNPAHEQRLAILLQEAGFIRISLSSELAPFIKALPRAQTAVVNAYLAPILNVYVQNVQESAQWGVKNPDIDSVSRLHLMTSAGGLVTAENFRPKDSLLSGPAGGIVGAATVGRQCGYRRIIAFDMGGTSTDVARYDGGYEYSFEHSVGDAHLVAPALAIESVAAGGGSICFADHLGLRVGPESAGAVPGPACYGAGGPLTVTDVNLLLGRILPERFEIPLSRNAAEVAANDLLRNLEQATGSHHDRDTVLRGMLDIANERMADAIRKISVRRGYDPAEYALVSFGGAGGQHACAIAERLGIRTILIPADASLLSAYGLANTSPERFVERQILRVLSESEFKESDIFALRDELAHEGINALKAEGETTASMVRCIVRLRLLGQESALDIEPDGVTSLTHAFAAQYAAVYGHAPSSGKTIEVESIRVIVATAVRKTTSAPLLEKASSPTPLLWENSAKLPVYEREAITDKDRIIGPALIVERHSVVVLEAKWHCRLLPENRALSLEYSCKFDPAHDGNETRSLEVNPVTLELFEARFAGIAEEMGEALRRAALSANIRERLDYSCAVLNPQGELIASAAHIPVHLGALGMCVRAVKAKLFRESQGFRPGDMIVTNHPAFGGSHLPDVTVIAPAFDTAGILLGFVANRAHHAEIGGTRPGSMPPSARTLAEEGVVIPPFLIQERGISHLDEFCALLTDAPYPTRNIADNRADLEAAIAANQRGVAALIELARQHGAGTIARFMDALTTRSERLARAALARLPDGAYAATQTLDDGAIIAVHIRINGETAQIDFTGTSATHFGNRNAPTAVTQSATLYVLRLLIGEPVSLNEGLLRPVTLILPPDTLVNPTFDPADPERCPAVVGGNTETSQRIVDTLLEALGLCAASQGTMNNTLWGAESFGYYETVGGGAGATANAPGASGVHTHMTNTRITDVEIIEARYPVRIERFALRSGSGGQGVHSGGDGILRETVFLNPMSLSLLTERRQSAPYGMAGGTEGAPGCQTLIRADGAVVPLASTAGAEVAPGDRLILETPGGGGFGSVDDL